MKNDLFLLHNACQAESKAKPNKYVLNTTTFTFYNGRASKVNILINLIGFKNHARLKGTVCYYPLVAQLSEPKSNPRPKIKESVFYRKMLKYQNVTLIFFAQCTY